MSNRHLIRSIVLQTLFEWDFRGQHNDTAFEALAYNLAEFGPGIDDDSFAQELLSLVLKKQSVIDQIIEEAAPDWPLDKISVVDRNVLRLGLVELLFGDRDQVPPKVAINEAIEIAKTFGGDNSGKFVNGVLGAVYKEIGEPGKEQTSSAKKHTESAQSKELPIEEKGGAVVCRKTPEGAWQIALVHDVFGYWTLPKGGIEEHEDPKEGTKREIKEEIDLDVTVDDLLGDNEYVASHPKKGKIRKKVYYYLAYANEVDLQLLNDSGGLDDARWFPVEEIPDLTIYDDILPIIAKAIKTVAAA